MPETTNANDKHLTRKAARTLCVFIVAPVLVLGCCASVVIITICRSSRCNSLDMPQALKGWDAVKAERYSTATSTRRPLVGPSSEGNAWDVYLRAPRLELSYPSEDALLGAKRSIVEYLRAGSKCNRAVNDDVTQSLSDAPLVYLSYLELILSAPMVSEQNVEDLGMCLQVCVDYVNAPFGFDIGSAGIHKALSLLGTALAGNNISAGGLARIISLTFAIEDHLPEFALFMAFHGYFLIDRWTGSRWLQLTQSEREGVQKFWSEWCQYTNQLRTLGAQFKWITINERSKRLRDTLVREGGALSRQASASYLLSGAWQLMVAHIRTVRGAALVKAGKNTNKVAWPLSPFTAAPLQCEKLDQVKYRITCEVEGLSDLPERFRNASWHSITVNMSGK